MKMTRKVAIVTGSNRGIGLAVVRGLCKRFDGDVYITALFKEQGREAVTKLEKEGLHPKFHQLDITDLNSVTKFRDHIKEKYGFIDILINNAVFCYKVNAPEPTSVQAVQTIGVNYFGLVLLCEHLFPLLRNGARVVNVASDLGHLSKIPSEKTRRRLQDPNLKVSELSGMMKEFLEKTKDGSHKAEWGDSSYTVAKAGVIALTKIYQRELNDRNIKVNAVHPGHVKTELTSFKGSITPDEGAQSSLYAALDAPDYVRRAFIWTDKTIVDWDGEFPANCSGEMNKKI